MLPQSRSPRVDRYLNEVSKTSAPAVPQSQSRWVLKSKLVSAHGFACFGSWIKEQVIFMCSVLVSVHGLKNKVYSCVAQRLWDCGSSIKEHDCGTTGAAFQVRYLVGQVFCNLAHNRTDVF